MQKARARLQVGMAIVILGAVATIGVTAESPKAPQFSVGAPVSRSTSVPTTAAPSHPLQIAPATPAQQQAVKPVADRVTAHPMWVTSLDGVNVRRDASSVSPLAGPAVGYGVVVMVLEDVVGNDPDGTGANRWARVGGGYVWMGVLSGSAPPPPPAPAPVVTSRPVSTSPSRSAPTAPHYSAPVSGGSISGRYGTLTDGQLYRLRMCESTNRYDNWDTGHNGHYGAYQFSPSTWRSVGGAGNPASASPAEQDMRARMLYARSGPGQWECKF